MKLTFIGNGNMAKALIQGLIDTYEIEVIGRNEISLNKLKSDIPNITTILIDGKVDMSNKNIILCVKPNSLAELSKNLKCQANCIISILAGTTIKSIKSSIDARHYIRSMPNIGAKYQKSMTTLTGDVEIKEAALEIFNKTGTALWLKNENEIDIATSVAGSGPAFLALIAESIADGAVKAGLKREDSQNLVTGLFDSFASLIKHDKPANIKDEVMSPGGTTAAGYSAMEKGNVRFAMIDAIDSAYCKAKELKEAN